MAAKWPSLKRQLDDAKASGTPLEQLIRDNQDFDLLAPEEASDDVDLPLWLRVYWRRTHRDVEHPTVNPGAGYPDVLYDIHARMLNNPDMQWDSPSDLTEE
jgi:hypothetical protein